MVSNLRTCKFCKRPIFVSYKRIGAPHKKSYYGGKKSGCMTTSPDGVKYESIWICNGCNALIWSDININEGEKND